VNICGAAREVADYHASGHLENRPAIFQTPSENCAADSPDTVGSFSTHHAQSTTTPERSRSDIVKQQYLVIDLLIFTLFSKKDVSPSG